MLKHRIIFGLLFIAILIGVFYLDVRLAGQWPNMPWYTPPGTVLAVVSFILVFLAIQEMRFLLAKQNVDISMRVCVVASFLCMFWPWLEQVAATKNIQSAGPFWSALSSWFHSVKPHYLTPTVLAISLVAAVIKHTRHQRISGAMANAGGTLLAIVYLGVLPGFFLPICLTHGAWMVLAIVAIVKFADIGAYITGRLIGRHKLIPWLSPGKTIEGFIGGLVFSSLTGLLVAFLFYGFKSPQVPIAGLIAGLLLGAVGQLGDLLESLLKRDAGVKDSGHVPGFGGVLDLLDSPLLAAPVAYWLLKLIGHTL